MVSKPQKGRPGHRVIFRPWRTRPDGTRQYAKDYGYKAWPMWIKDE